MLRGLLWLLTPMKRASTHPLVDLCAGGGHVIAGLLEPLGDSSEGLFLALSHCFQTSESVGHVFNVCEHRLVVAPCSCCQRSTLAYIEQFPAELTCSFDVIGCSYV